MRRPKLWGNCMILVALLAPWRQGWVQECPPDDRGLLLPPRFCAIVFADGFGFPRHMTVAPNGDVFVAVLGYGRPGGVYLLRDTSGNGVADIRRLVISDSTVGDVKLWTAPGVTYLYYATFRHIIRVRWELGELQPRGRPDTIVRGLPGVGQHRIKTIAFGRGNRLYVNVGAPSNACQRADRVPGSPGIDPCPELHSTGGIWEFDALRTGQTQRDGRRHATGIRNAVAIAVQPTTGDLYAVIHGRDELSRLWGFSDSANAEKPSEEFVLVERGDDFGWPYCYHDPELGHKVLAPEYGGDGREVGRCVEAKSPIIAFPAHWAPNGLHFYEGNLFPRRYHGGAFIAFHGSWNRAPLPQQGYS